MYLLLENQPGTVGYCMNIIKKNYVDMISVLSRY